MKPERFSTKFGYTPGPLKAALPVPADFIHGIIQVFKDVGLRSDLVRASVAAHLRRREDTTAQRDSEIWKQVEAVLETLEWFQVFDVLQRLHHDLSAAVGTTVAPALANAVNEYFRDAGITFQLASGEFIVRGGDTFQYAVESAIAKCANSNRSRARNEMHEALRDMSRRPDPDVTGALHHAMAALEAIAREAAGDPNATLGAILKHHPDLVPKPLDTAIEKVWGYCSERARHAREGEIVCDDDAELIVCLAAAIGTYILNKTEP
jgi:hypothetical protein